MIALDLGPGLLFFSEVSYNEIVTLYYDMLIAG